AGPEREPVRFYGAAQQVPVNLLDETLIRGANVVRQVSGHAQIRTVGDPSHKDATVGLKDDRLSAIPLADKVRGCLAARCEGRIQTPVRIEARNKEVTFITQTNVSDDDDFPIRLRNDTGSNG